MRCFITAAASITSKNSFLIDSTHVCSWSASVILGHQFAVLLLENGKGPFSALSSFSYILQKCLTLLLHKVQSDIPTPTTCPHTSVFLPQKHPLSSEDWLAVFTSETGRSRTVIKRRYSEQGHDSGLPRSTSPSE